MIERNEIVAFCAGAITVALVAAASLSVKAQGKAPDAVVACVGADRIFRLGAIDQGCAPSEQRYVLSPAKPEIEEPKVVNSVDPLAAKAPSEARIRALEEQVQQLQQEAVRSRELSGKLPFVLVDQSGKPAFTVRQTPAGPLVELFSNGRPVIEVGFGPRGNPRLAVMKPDGSPAVAVGTSPEGIGAITAYDGGQPTASLIGGGPSGPVMGVGNGKDLQFIASLGAGKNGGKLELADRTGGIKAAGGVLDSGSGVFRVHGEVFQYISGQNLRLPGWF